MRAASAKAKGRRAAAELREVLLSVLPLEPSDVMVVPSGVTGEDLWLSGAARKLCPFAFEVKNREALNIWDAIAQAESHAAKAVSRPAVAFRRNRSSLYVAIKAEHFAELLHAASCARSIAPAPEAPTHSG